MQQYLWFKELKEPSIDLEIDQEEFIWVCFFGPVYKVRSAIP